MLTLPGADADGPPEYLLALGSERLAAASLSVLRDQPEVLEGAALGPKCIAFEVAADKPAGLVLVWSPSGFGGDYSIKLS